MKTVTAKKVVFEKETLEYNGESIEVLNIVQGLEHMDMSNNKCCLCGLTIRNGNHSYSIHKSNIGPSSMTLLPVSPSWLWEDYEISQGGSAIGSECRKQLPAEYVIKWSDK
jgi:hypothetical protein